MVVKKIYLKSLLTFSLLALLPSILRAQSGNISGTIVDSKSGEPLIGVTVLIEGTATGNITDISGNYQIAVNPGSYTLVASYVSYANQKVEAVAVMADETTTINLKMFPEDVQLGEIVVQADAINNNEVALLKLQQKSYAVQDGISSGEIQRLGISNAAESMRQVTGASVQGGKYVVMRGLGDRYSLTSLNGIAMPSTDPYRNAAAMDLIPTAMVENIVAIKTFTPDQPGNFTGGNINVTTKSLPSQFYFNFGASVAYNTVSSFQEDFLTDPVQGSTDWLGYDDGSRQLPELLQNPANRETLADQSLYTKVRSSSENYTAQRQLFDEAAKALSKNGFVPATKNTGLNQSYSLSFGDRLNLFSKRLGYHIGLNYSRSYTHYQDKTLNIFEFSSDPNAESLNTNLGTTGQQSFEDIKLGGILSLAYQLNNEHELNFTTTYTHDSEQAAGQLTGTWPGAISGAHTFISRNIAFKERALANYQLGGKHVLPTLNNASIEWVGGMTQASQDEPDIRIFANDYNDTGYALSKAEYDLPFHFWRKLEDNQYNFNLDITVPFQRQSENKLKFGGLFSHKERNFDEFRFQLQTNGTRESAGEYLSFNEAAGDYKAFLSPYNAGILGNSNQGNILGNYYLDQSRLTNFYTGTEAIWAGYGMLVYKIFPQLKFVGGARIEQTDYEVVSADPGTREGRIEELDILPSINLIYALSEDANIRMSASQTLARPNMREMAPFTSVDFIGGYFFRGNPDLKRTTVRNYDLRYELFPSLGELIAVSVFYKDFTDPIVKVLEPIASGGQLTTANVAEAKLLGFELELRKNLTEKLQLGTNFTYINAEVDLTEEELSAFRAVNPNIESTRPFQGQSPFIFNLNLTYSDYERSFESTLYMNMFGRRLYANGFGGAPDIYEMYGNNENKIPTPDLNFVVSKGLNANFDVTLKFLNILNYKTVRNQEFKDQLYVTESFEKGRTFSLGISYHL